MLQEDRWSTEMHSLFDSWKNGKAKSGKERTRNGLLGPRDNSSVGWFGNNCLRFLGYLC